MNTNSLYAAHCGDEKLKHKTQTWLEVFNLLRAYLYKPLYLLHAAFNICIYYQEELFFMNCPERKNITLNIKEEAMVSGQLFEAFLI